MTEPRNPLHDHDCPACGKPCGMGRTHFGELIEFDLGTKIYALVGNSPLKVVETEQAVVPHKDVCAYRDV